MFEYQRQYAMEGAAKYAVLAQNISREEERPGVFPVWFNPYGRTICREALSWAGLDEEELRRMDPARRAEVLDEAMLDPDEYRWLDA